MQPDYETKRADRPAKSQAVQLACKQTNRQASKHEQLKLTKLQKQSTYIYDIANKEKITRENNQ